MPYDPRHAAEVPKGPLVQPEKRFQLLVPEAQVDFFRGAPSLDGATGEWRRPWVFRMTLGHSRHGYEEAPGAQ